MVLVVDITSKVYIFSIVVKSERLVRLGAISRRGTSIALFSKQWSRRISGEILRFRRDFGESSAHSG
ncbi:hypothetical protein HanRHA438_Chr16g0768441 [Helianthus annuus]|nr:hypothetical protein HanRHA438_Chr16g0768441 [Helianthus annuus]